MPYYQSPTQRAYAVSLLKILLNYQYVAKWPGVLKDKKIFLSDLKVIQDSGQRTVEVGKWCPAGEEVDFYCLSAGIQG
jgi:hypothetical protein